MKLTIEKATEIAMNAAKESTERHKMGAVLFCGNKYVSACNRVFSVIVTGRSTPYSSHAEASVIDHGLHLGFNLNHSTLVVVRINNKGSLMLARPCKHCQQLIESMKIPYTYYSNDPLNRELIPENFKSL